MTQMNKDLLIGDLLYKGEYAAIWLGFHVPTKTMVHYVVVNCSAAREILDLDRILAMSPKLREVNHQTILKYYKVLQKDSQVDIVLEHPPGGSLRNFLLTKPDQRISESEAKLIFKQLTEGVDVLHNAKIIHRNLNIKNIFLDPELNVKVGDFLICHKIGPLQKSSQGSTSSYHFYAPEIWLSDSGPVTGSADVWSLGVILYVMTCGCYPFDGTDEFSLFWSIKSGRFALPSFLSTELVGLLKLLLHPSPGSRPRISDVKSHDWLLKENTTPNPIASKSADTNSPMDLPSPTSPYPFPPSSGGNNNNINPALHSTSSAPTYGTQPQQPKSASTPNSPMVTHNVPSSPNPYYDSSQQMPTHVPLKQAPKIRSQSFEGTNPFAKGAPFQMPNMDVPQPDQRKRRFSSPESSMMVPNFMDMNSSVPTNQEYFSQNRMPQQKGLEIIPEEPDAPQESAFKSAPQFSHQMQQAYAQQQQQQHQMHAYEQKTGHFNLRRSNEMPYSTPTHYDYMKSRNPPQQQQQNPFTSHNPYVSYDPSSQGFPFKNFNMSQPTFSQQQQQQQPSYFQPQQQQPQPPPSYAYPPQFSHQMQQQMQATTSQLHGMRLQQQPQQQQSSMTSMGNQNQGFPNTYMTSQSNSFVVQSNPIYSTPQMSSHTFSNASQYSGHEDSGLGPGEGDTPHSSYDNEDPGLGGVEHPNDPETFLNTEFQN